MAGDSAPRAARGAEPGERLASVDEVRYRDLYAAYAGAVLAYCLRRTATRADAEDVMVEAFSVAWRRLDVVPEEPATLPWLYVVAGNVLRNQRRAEQTRRRLVTRLAQERDVPTPPPGDAALDLAMEELRPQDQELLRLMAWEDLGPTELAVVLECSPGAAAVRAHRARRALAQAYEQVLERGAAEGGGGDV